MSRTRIVLLVGLLMAWLPVRGAAQAPVAAGVPAGCTYATCALQVDQGFWGPKLVRGESAETVSRLIGFGRGVDPLLTGPDSAAAYAWRYVRASQRSTVLGLAAGVAYLVLLTRTDSFSDTFDDTSVITAVAAAGFSIASIPFEFQARRNLSRAVWWYNAALPC